jgi:hypothetical protein
VVPRRDTAAELYVTVLSGEAHIQAETGRLITCPFIPGALSESAMALVVAVGQPSGVLLPELIQWLPSSAGRAHREHRDSVASRSHQDHRRATWTLTVSDISVNASPATGAEAPTGRTLETP